MAWKHAAIFVVLVYFGRDHAEALARIDACAKSYAASSEHISQGAIVQTTPHPIKLYLHACRVRGHVTRMLTDKFQSQGYRPAHATGQQFSRGCFDFEGTGSW